MGHPGTGANYIDVSAMDDDDDSWYSDESEGDSSEPSTVQKPSFDRIDYKARLSTRQSLITVLIEAHNDEALNRGNSTSPSTPTIAHTPVMALNAAKTDSPDDADDQCLMMPSRGRTRPLKPTTDVARSGPQPIPRKPKRSHHSAATSPGTTRVNHAVHGVARASPSSAAVGENPCLVDSQRSPHAPPYIRRHHEPSGTTLKVEMAATNWKATATVIRTGIRK